MTMITCTSSACICNFVIICCLPDNVCAFFTVYFQKPLWVAVSMLKATVNRTMLRPFMGKCIHHTSSIYISSILVDITKKTQTTNFDRYRSFLISVSLGTEVYNL